MFSGFSLPVRTSKRSNTCRNYSINHIYLVVSCCFWHGLAQQAVLAIGVVVALVDGSYGVGDLNKKQVRQRLNWAFQRVPYEL